MARPGPPVLITRELARSRVAVGLPHGVELSSAAARKSTSSQGCPNQGPLPNLKLKNRNGLSSGLGLTGSRILRRIAGQDLNL